MVVTTTYESVEISHVSHFQAAWERCRSKSIWQNRKHRERTINQSVQHVCCTWSVMLKPMLMCRLCARSLKLIKSLCLEVRYTCSFTFVLFSTLSCRVNAFETFSLLLLSSKFSALSHNPLPMLSTLHAYSCTAQQQQRSTWNHHELQAAQPQVSVAESAYHL